MADWCRMWESLGLNLEAHDQLLNALPPIYQEIYLNQENRPEKMEYLLQKKLKKEVIVPEEPQIVGVLGAALYSFNSNKNFWLGGKG